MRLIASTAILVLILSTPLAHVARADVRCNQASGGLCVKDGGETAAIAIGVVVAVLGGLAIYAAAEGSRTQAITTAPPSDPKRAAEARTNAVLSAAFQQHPEAVSSRAESKNVAFTVSPTVTASGGGVSASGAF